METLEPGLRPLEHVGRRHAHRVDNRSRYGPEHRLDNLDGARSGPRRPGLRNALPPGHRRPSRSRWWAGSAARVAQVLSSPARVSCATLVAAAVFVGLRVVVAGRGRLGSLVLAGSDYVRATPRSHGVPITPGTGYDGQFYYRLALGPLTWAKTAFGITFDTLGRLDRISYPALAWLLSAGRASAVPAALVAVNVAALGALAFFAAGLARHAGRHPAWGLFMAGYCGFLWTLSRDLTELVEAAALVGGLLAVRRGRPVLAGAALSVAVLAREPALLVVAALCLSRAWGWAWALFRRDRGSPAASWPGRPHAARARAAGVDAAGARAGVTGAGVTGADASWADASWADASWADAAWAIPVLAFVAWQVAVRARIGAFPALISGGDNLGLPFAGLAAGLAHWTAALPKTAALLWVGEIAVLALVGASAAFSLRHTKAAPYERVAWAATGLLALLLVKGIWVGDVGFRSLDDFYVLSGVLLVFSPLRLRLTGVAVGLAWSVVAVELVRFV